MSSGPAVFVTGALGVLGVWALCPGARVEAEGPSAAEQQAAAESIHEAALRAHTQFLASDDLEGRGPGSRGDRLSQQYIAARFEAAGLRPAAPGGGWLQQVDLVGVRTRMPDRLRLALGDKSVSLKRGDDFVVNVAQPAPEVAVKDAELVFVGYGIVAPEYDWDDFKGVDLRGKVLVMMNNDPSDDPELFEGRRRLYYGRWDYKYASAARRGAAGAIIIHTTPSAGYPYSVVQSSWTGEEFELAGRTDPRLKVSGWFAEPAARQVIELAGRELDALRAAAERRDFRPVPLGARLSLALTADVRRNATRNVLGVLPGRDPALREEMVVFTAHHDHLGLAEQRDASGDRIYNGAVDNASGVAALLAIADACARLPEAERPARSLLFAAVGAEEQGLLGSQHLAAHPPVPAGRLAAVVNIDGLNIWGRTRDINVIGHGKSDLDQLVAAAAKRQSRTVLPDSFPDRGYYYRSDQFSLAKVGVPGVYLHAGVHVIGREEGWGKRQQEQWVETRYHQVGDEYDASWDLAGAVEDVRLLFHVGLAAANREALPQWNAGDEFEAARRRAIEAARESDFRYFNAESSAR